MVSVSVQTILEESQLLTPLLTFEFYFPVIFYIICAFTVMIWNIYHYKKVLIKKVCWIVAAGAISYPFHIFLDGWLAGWLHCLHAPSVCSTYTLQYTRSERSVVFSPYLDIKKFFHINDVYIENWKADEYKIVTTLYIMDVNNVVRS